MSGLFILESIYTLIIHQQNNSLARRRTPVYQSTTEPRGLESIAIYHRKKTGTPAAGGSDAEAFWKGPDRNVWYLGRMFFWLEARSCPTMEGRC
jgi:hypothetical protein